LGLGVLRSLLFAFTLLRVALFTLGLAITRLLVRFRIVLVLCDSVLLVGLGVIRFTLLLLRAVFRFGRPALLGLLHRVFGGLLPLRIFRVLGDVLEILSGLFAFFGRAFLHLFALLGDVLILVVARLSVVILIVGVLFALLVI